MLFQQSSHHESKAFRPLTPPVCVCLPENRLQVVKGLDDTEVSECESCSFEVSLNLAYIEGVWMRDGTQLKSKPNCRISTHGKKHSLLLNRVALGDAGLFSFQANGIQTSGRLTVRGNVTELLACSQDWMFLYGPDHLCVRSQNQVSDFLRGFDNLNH